MTEAELRDVLDCLPQGTLVVDRGGRIVCLNRAATVLLRDGRGAAGESLSSSLRPEHAATLTEALAEVTATGYALPTRIEVEVAEGARAPMLISAALCGRGKEARIVVSLQDGSAEAELARSRQRQQRQRGQVVEVAHDLLNPLGAVIGNLQLALDVGRHEPLAWQCVQRAGTSAQRALRLMRDILDESRVESGQAQLRRESVDVGAMLHALVEPLRATTGTLSLHVEVEPGLPSLIGDRARLERVIANLIDNAIKFTPAGGRVSVVARRVDDLLELEVADTGVGIPADDLSRIFERHYRARVPAVRELPGSGLGLAIVKSVVEAHGGAVQVESAPGRGSRFTVRLPLPRTARALARQEA